MPHLLGLPVARVYGFAAAAVLSVSLVPAAAANRTVPAGADLQAAIDAAQPGDVILLTPGATYTGNFRLTVKPGDAVITIRTGGDARRLPAGGTRMTPEYSPFLAKLQSPNTKAALSTAASAHHWRIELVEFLANEKGSGDIIRLGDSSQTDVAQMPHDLFFDRVYIHGDPIVGQKRGIALNSGLTYITNSYIADIKSVGQDSQAIAGWNGSGPYVIENNYLEGAGENVLFGGSDPKVWNLVPSDIVIRGNTFSKPLQWRNEKWQVKNAFELKNARRVLVEDNIFEHVWRDAQAGYAILFSTRNQDGKAPWSIVEDVTFRRNIVRHAANAINISGIDYNHPSAQGRRYNITDNLFYDIDGDRWGGNGIFLQIGNEPRDVAVERNTVLHTGTVIQAYGKSNGVPRVTDGFVFRDNLMRHNKYGVKGESTAMGRDTLAAFFSRTVFERNVLAGGKASQYPGANYFPSVAEFNASFVDPEAGDFTLVPGSQFATGASHGGAIGAYQSR